jgi:hypothetical protein
VSSALIAQEQRSHEPLAAAESPSSARRAFPTEHADLLCSALIVVVVFALMPTWHLATELTPVPRLDGWRHVAHVSNLVANLKALLGE